MPSVLILCNGNSCRSQMAEGILKVLNPPLSFYSVGANPAPEVHPKAIKVMAESGIDISGYSPKSIERFLGTNLDYIITVCDQARETYPVFTGSVRQRLHMSFEDPARARGTEEEILTVFRRVRDEIRAYFEQFNQHYLQ